MITQSILERHLSSQGCTSSPFSTLRDAGLIRPESNVALSADEVATVLLACTAEGDVVGHVEACKGISLHDALVKALEGDPAKAEIQSIHICTSVPFASINLLSGEVLEFCNEEIKPCAFRREVVISGGLFSLIQMKLHFENKSGWKEDSENES